jgi:hypothetical protein
VYRYALGSSGLLLYVQRSTVAENASAQKVLSNRVHSHGGDHQTLGGNSVLRRPNLHVKLTAERRCRSVPSVLRTPAAAYVRRLGTW